MEEETKVNFPNWDSVVENYLLAAETYGNETFSTDALAVAKLGTTASRGAIESESTSLYNIMRSAAMYGLVEWHGGKEFHARVLPEDEQEAWEKTFAEQSKTVNSLVKKAVEDKKELEQVSKKEIETAEKEGKMYLEAFVGPETSVDRLDAFVYSTWDPANHAGVVIKSWGRNIRTAKAIADDLIEKSRIGETAFSYRKKDEEFYRNEDGFLCGRIWIEITIG